MMNDLEEDSCLIDEDCVDGCIPSYSSYGPMVPRNIITPQNIISQHHHSNFPHNTDISKFELDKDSLEQFDSVLNSGKVEDIFQESPVRLSSIGDVDNDLEKLTIRTLDGKGNLESKIHNSQFKENNVKVKELDQETCLSVDHGYYSGETQKSTFFASEVQKIFCHQDLDGDSQAHLLLIHGEINTFIQLLTYITTAAFLNVQNNLQQSLLHLAVIMHLPQVVRKLVARGADINVRDKCGNTPLHLACIKGDYHSVVALTTPLEPREVKDVLYSYPYRRIPQDQHIMNYEGLTCVHLAANSNNMKVVNYLLTKCNADINSQEGKGGETILHQAVENNNVSLVKFLLLHRDLHLEATRYDGSSALLLAQGRNNQVMQELLLSAGALDSGYSEEMMDNQQQSTEQDSKPSFTYDDFHIEGSLVSL